MNRLLGYTLITLGLVAFVFFMNYKGTAIPLKELWFVLSLFVIAAGFYFLVKYKWNTKIVEQHSDANSGFSDRLKQTGEMVRVTWIIAKLKQEPSNRKKSIESLLEWKCSILCKVAETIKQKRFSKPIWYFIEAMATKPTSSSVELLHRMT